MRSRQGSGAIVNTASILAANRHAEYPPLCCQQTCCGGLNQSCCTPFPQSRGIRPFMLHPIERQSITYGRLRQRWLAQTPAGFKFCLKFPRAITHNGSLVPYLPQAQAFITQMQALGDRLGVMFIQLPPNYSPSSGFSDLSNFLSGLPRQDANIAFYANSIRFSSRAIGKSHLARRMDESNSNLGWSEILKYTCSCIVRSRQSLQLMRVIYTIFSLDRVLL